MRLLLLIGLVFLTACSKNLGSIQFGQNTSDLQSDFTITGIRSANGLDVTTDQYLNYGASPRILYGTSSGASSYDVTIFETDGVTVKCALQNTALTTFDPTACNLTGGDTYKLAVRAKNAAGFGHDATNSPYTFIYNRAPVIGPRGTWNFSPGTGRTFNVLADDPATGSVDPATDADSDTLTVVSVTAATNGTSAVDSTSTISYTPNASYDGADSFTVTISDGRGATATATVSVSSIAPFRWIGGGVDANWNTFSNWCGTVGGGGAGTCQGNASSAPGVNDVAIFDGSCVQCNSTINIPITVKGIEMRTGYTGTLTQNAAAHLTVQLSGWKLVAGSFVGSNNAATNVTIQGGMFLLESGGSFTAPRGNFTLNSNDTAAFARTTVPIPVTNLHKFLGTFSHNLGTVVLSGNVASGSASGQKLALIDFGPAVTFNHLTVNYYNSSVAPTAASSNYFEFSESTDNLLVNGNLTITSGSVKSGNMDVAGNILANCSANTSCAKVANAIDPVKLTSSGASSTYGVVSSAYGTPELPHIIVNKASPTDILSSLENAQIRMISLTVSSGEFSAPSSKLQLGKMWAFPLNTHYTGAGLTINGGSFTHNNGTVEISAGVQMTGTAGGSRAFNIDIPDPGTKIDLNHLTVDISPQNLTFNLNQYVKLTSTTDFNVQGNLEIKGGYFLSDGYPSVGKMNLYGNLIASCTSSLQCAVRTLIDTGTEGAPAIVLSGANAQTITTDSTSYLPGLVMKKTAIGNTVTAATSPLNIAFLEIEQGTLTLPAQTNIGIKIRGGSIGRQYSGLTFKAGAGNGALNHSNGKITFNTEWITSLASMSLFGAMITSNNRLDLELYDLEVDLKILNSGYYPRVGLFNSTGADHHAIKVANDLTIRSGNLAHTIRHLNPTTTPQVHIGRNLNLLCASTLSCSYQGVTNNAPGSSLYGTYARFYGSGAQIFMAAGAQMPFNYIEVDLPDNFQVLTLTSNVSGAELNQYSNLAPYWTNLNLKKGQINLGAYSFTGIGNLDIAAGTSCSGVLSYNTSSGFSGSGCGP